MSTSIEELQDAQHQLQQEALLLAGGLSDLPQRATTYHHVYRDSDGNHVFPLIAAHGALWAKGYFQFGMLLGRLLALQYGFDSQRRAAQLTALQQFADAFREINRLVCVDTYVNYHLVKRYDETSALTEVIPVELLAALGRVHHARQRGIALTDLEKRAVFRAHFLYEQEHIVGPRVEQAMQQFAWPVLQAIAIRPWIRFAYFRPWQFFWFRDFTNRDERIRNGLRAFDFAAAAGWTQVEANLRHYELLPQQFFSDSREHFGRLRTQLLAQH